MSEWPKFRYRRNWLRLLVLQIGEKVPANYDPGDPFDISGPKQWATKWRDAKIEDFKA